MAKQVKYKGYPFPSTLTKLEIKYLKDIEFSSLPFAEKRTGDVKGQRKAVFGEGVLEAKNSDAKINEMLLLYNDDIRGDVEITGIPVFTAYFSAFSSVSLPGSNIVKFRFELIEEI